jgi:hypothetical protein
VAQHTKSIRLLALARLPFFRRALYLAPLNTWLWPVAAVVDRTQKVVAVAQVACVRVQPQPLCRVIQSPLAAAAQSTGTGLPLALLGFLQQVAGLVGQGRLATAAVLVAALAAAPLVVLAQRVRVQMAALLALLMAFHVLPQAVVAGLVKSAVPF